MSQVSNGLNLFLKLKEPSRMASLLAYVQARQPGIQRALKELNYVHFARFVPTPDFSTLMVITEFDGDMKSYVMDFAAVIGEEFSGILEYIQDAPPLPVQRHPREFWEFVRLHSQPQPSVWSAYEEKTVLDIVGVRSEIAGPLAHARPSLVDASDVQGNVLRGYRGSHACHLALVVEDAAAARACIGKLADGIDGHPRVSTDQEWGDPKVRPPYCLNLSFTYAGLGALGVDVDVLLRFPPAFREGPGDPERAAANGDTGASAPAGWTLGSPRRPAVHAVLSLYTRQSADLQDLQDRLARLLPAGGWRIEGDPIRADRLPEDRLHFGYVDSIAQPALAIVRAGSSAPPTDAGTPDLQPRAAVGDFLLGKDYVNHAGGNYIDRLPAALCDNGTYAALRILEQDVFGFESLLRDVAQKHKLPFELVAAKLMGRWRDGAPLSTHPAQASGRPADDVVNRFDYVRTPEDPEVVDDSAGRRCPVASHIRRLNPRGSSIAGKQYSHRLIRRGMPYGPAYDYTLPKLVKDDVRRGLASLFICGDLENQFDFLMRFWANGDQAAPGLRGSRDPIMGGGDKPVPFTFHAREGEAPITIEVPRFVTTVGSLYLFMPGIGGLRHLAGMQAPRPRPLQPAPSKPLPETFDPAGFNPHDPAFLADPYPTYAWFRRHRPVFFVGGRHKGHWVFTHRLVGEVLARTGDFLKNPAPLENNIGDVVQSLENGLFFMDPPRHTQVRGLLDPRFADAMAGADAVAAALGAALLKGIGGGRPFALISDYVQKFCTGMFAHVMGLAPAHLPVVVSWVNAALDGNNKEAPELDKAKAFTSRLALGGYFQAVRGGCPVTGAGQPPGLLGAMAAITQNACPADPQHLSPVEFQQTAAHFALGGYLSAQFLMATGVRNLLDHPDQLDLLRTDPSLIPQAVQELLRYDAPFQLTDRYAARDTELGGYSLKKGDKVTMVFGSANRDEQVFEGPDRLDVRRSFDADRPHFSFGASIHYCIGAPLVEAAVPMGLSRLIFALPKLRVDASKPMQWRADPYFRSPVELALLSG